MGRQVPEAAAILGGAIHEGQTWLDINLHQVHKTNENRTIKLELSPQATPQGCRDGALFYMQDKSHTSPPYKVLQLVREV